MSKVAKVDNRVKEYLEEAGCKKWFRCHSPVNRGRMMMSNIAECINGCLVKVKATASYLYCVYELGRRYIIDIERGTCNCGRYQIDKIPCPHAFAVLKSKNVDVKDYGRYCSELYRPNIIVKTYKFLIVPMSDMRIGVFLNL
ncbi:uncharacterized protein LOC124896774 [Capsicum annuum]|uniref:uncharacterized protein LOC124896774 n=1 Tax=Capsicum annuum TaxID=4072 RepID=UPI001FB07471|nr:uncharacterized protein LOC124896774 [Capsicum annuum]